MRFQHLGFAAIVLASLSFLAALSMPAAAHHSHAMYDRTVRMVVEAKVKEYIWGNPHVWLYVEISDESGQTLAACHETAGPRRA